MKSALAAEEIECFRSLIVQRLGLYFEDARLDFLKDILKQRIKNTGRQCFSSYRQLLNSGAAAREIGALAEQLTVCETYFFRYAPQWKAFAELVIPDRMQARGRQRKLRILSAGCASGEEAHSVAMLIRERLPELATWDVEIHGIDANPAMVGKARRGSYSTWSLRETPADLRAEYFRAEGPDLQLDAAVRSACTFEVRNLVEEDPLFWRGDAFDVVFCRNVTMYFPIDVARGVISRIAQSLAPGGFLFLGHAETLRAVSQEFHLRHTHETFYYQRREGHEMDQANGYNEARAKHGTFRTAISPVMAPGDTWFDVVRQSSERIANLTQGKSHLVMGASVSFAASAPVGDRSSSASPKPAPATRSWNRALAIDLLQKERFAEAIELLRALPPESKVDPDSQLLLAVLLTNGGALAEAEKVCQNVLQLDELNAGAHYLMALCREHAGDRDAAKEHDKAATYLDSAFSMPHLHLGLVAKRSADVETARHELEQALPLLDREDASRILLFGGGFTREALVEFCRGELRGCGGPR
jgi:chemotaxis protein methyltransferase CheR